MLVWARREQILELLLEGPKTAKDIFSKINISRTTCYEILKRLEEEGLIKKSPGKPAFYSLTPTGKALLNQPEVNKARVHNIKVVCHVFEINLHRVAELGREVKLNNWTAYYIDLAEICRRRGIPELNATVQINDAENRTAVLHLSEFYASSRNEAAKIIHNTFNKIRRILELEGIILDEDWLDLDFIFGEFAFETDDPIDPGTEIRLNRPAKDLQGKETKQEARVWVDESKGKREIETNDSDYWQDKLLMPVRVAKIDEIEADVKETKEDLKQIKSAILTESTAANQTYQNLLALHDALAENIAKHLMLTDNVASTAGEMANTLRELNKHYRLLFIGQVLLYILLAVIILKEVIN
jgi:DNA-binding MarR family transcriptional regulator